MHQLLEEICVRLEKTAERIRATNPGVTKTLKEEFNWNFPPLNRDDLAEMALRIVEKIKAADISDDEVGEVDNLSDVPRRLELLWSETIPNLNGNFPAVWAIIASFDALDKALEPVLGPQKIEDPRYLPPKLAGRLRLMSRRLDVIDNEHDKLAERVQAINNAHAAAEALPTTLQELEDARITLEELRGKIEKIYAESTKAEGKVEANLKAGEEKLADLYAYSEQAKKLIAQCEDAYQITTTKGLAGAFDQRAWWLNLSIVLWVVGLLGALYFGAEFGAKRIDALSDLTAKGTPEWGIIVMHVILSILSVGGPLWFAWLATKQIGQRFRLAEDYAFKASVAKAYEGYRKQAANLDEAFSARLFSSALSRLDEAPLRLVEQDAHGSPWHEASQSELIKTAIATVPGFGGTIADMAKKALDSAAGAVSSRFRPSAAAKTSAEAPNE